MLKETAQDIDLKPIPILCRLRISDFSMIMIVILSSVFSDPNLHEQPFYHGMV